MIIESIPKMVGMAYAVIASVAIAFLLYKGKFSRRAGYVFLAVSTAIGFLAFAPMLPVQMQALLLGNTGKLGVPLAMAIVVLLLFLALAFVLGRTFCGYVCPIGAPQELLYRLPVKKWRIKSKALPVAFRLIFLLAFVAAALALSTGLLKYLGIRAFFHLEFSSAYFYVFLALLVASASVYRPFCRFLCPYGALLSLASTGGLFKLRRNDDCTYCGKCEDACPTNEAGETDLKQECYMCNRCKDACPADAVHYSKKRSEV
ncbi:MAG: 4Fe-4S binding protein [Chloroflexota bacterium]|nr:4Fe-4S binding protein [Chloroflexota bacterium]